MSITKCNYGDLLQQFGLSTPIGLIEIVNCSIGLHNLKFIRFSITISAPDTIEIISRNHQYNNHRSLNEVISYLTNYFSPSTSVYPLPSICWSGISTDNSFTQKVLKTLFNNIQTGSTISYKDLALSSGYLNSQQAVGSVMKKNPISLIIPCHRVINSNSKIGNYNGGVEIKKWLLDHEKKSVITEKGI